MSYIKKMVLKGFKSFAKETEVPFTNAMNVIVGPNGSGKSNIADAICFVLGRLSMKSIRASKSSNLIFSAPHSKPSWEASVKIIFDNSDKKFPLEVNEISIERIVRRGGQGIYKINNETKTRQEVLELLSTAGIDPYGFNIVLQGEITDIVKKTPEERRKVLEEVSGIAIYEQRKERSLSELEKTESRLKEAEAVLRERTAYLRNLEQERKQALKSQDLQLLLKKIKASIFNKRIEDKNKQLENIKKETQTHEKEKEKEKNELLKIEGSIKELEKKVSEIDIIIQKSSGIEQEKLYAEITQLKSDLAGLDVNKNNAEIRIVENNRRLERSKQELAGLEKSLEILKKGFENTIKQKDLENKRTELEEVEKQKEELYNLKLKLKLTINKTEEKSRQSIKSKNQITFLVEEIRRIEQELSYNDESSCRKIIEQLRKSILNKSKEFEEKSKETLQLEKEISTLESEIENADKIRSQVKKIVDICPLCRSKITQEHSHDIEKECSDKIFSCNKKIEENKNKINKIQQDLDNLKKELKEEQEKIRTAEIDIFKLQTIEGKKSSMKSLDEENKNLEKEIIVLETERRNLEKKVAEKRDIEEKYNNIILEIQEISSRTEKNLNSELEAKQRDFEKVKIFLKQTEKDKKELEEELLELEASIENKNILLEKSGKKEEEFNIRYQKLIQNKTELQKKIHENNKLTLETQNKINLITTSINQKSVDRARVDAEKQALDTDFKIYENIEILPLSLNALEEKLARTEETIREIGEVNMLSLQAYDNVKKDYEEITNKVELLRKEGEEIKKIIEDVDKKKTKTFMRTLNAINELFTRNFMQLSTKGQAFLELENEKDPFAGGLNIIIKVAKGKYFDVSSLSGGEKSLVALSLIFAIQEYKPYTFYIFDEVDAALDKRNSERLTLLLKKHMKAGQYIIITHNDAIIEEASILYGVSMQEGESRIFSMKI